MMSTAARMSRGCGFSGWTAKYCAITSVAPLRPHGRQHLRQRRQLSGLERALPGPVVIGAARGEETVFLRRTPPHRILLRPVAAGDHFDRLAPQPAEFLEQLATRPGLQV